VFHLLFIWILRIALFTIHFEILKFQLHFRFISLRLYMLLTSLSCWRGWGLYIVLAPNKLYGCAGTTQLILSVCTVQYSTQCEHTGMTTYNLSLCVKFTTFWFKTTPPISVRVFWKDSVARFQKRISHNKSMIFRVAPVARIYQQRTCNELKRQKRTVHYCAEVCALRAIQR